MPKKQESTGGVTWGQMEEKGKTCNLILTGMLNRGGQKGKSRPEERDFELAGFKPLTEEEGNLQLDGTSEADMVVNSSQKALARG